MSSRSDDRGDGRAATSWETVLKITRDSALRRRNSTSVSERAKAVGFLEWVLASAFTVDREPFSFDMWRYLRPIYSAIPRDPTDLDLVIMKSAQGGASTFALIFVLWLALRARCQVAYFLPTDQLARTFSLTRFIHFARANPEVHRLMGDPGDPRERRAVHEGSGTTRRIAESILHFTSIAGKVTTEALPLDGLVFDEVQEMMLSDIEKAEERLSASALRVCARVSTANFSGADIHYFYERSDQREFYTRCGCPEGIVLADAWDPHGGPLCIDKGNGSTPGVPKTWFFFCPRCGSVLNDPQDGEYRARNPGVSRIGFHFPQLLSPRQSATSIIQKWERRVDVKNFYNRVLGKPYADPDTLPVTQEHLERAQNPDLTWGPATRGTVDGVFMGIDQMGHENYVVVKARVGDRMRLLHLEIVQDDDPWRRCAAIIKEYRVQTASVEANPNFNEAHRFAKAHDGRVFVAHYGALDDEIVRWGDRTRDPIGVRRSEDDIRTPWTVLIDQYKMMSWSLGKWARYEVETPDARSRTQFLRTSRGRVHVAVCRDVFWLHLQRVALVTEPVQGREDERLVRRAVKKIGVDPHFAFANMLCDVASMRTQMTAQILTSGVRDDRPDGPNSRSPAMQQIEDVIPWAFWKPDPSLNCGNCANFDRNRALCGVYRFQVSPELPSCDSYDPLPEDEDGY